MCDNIAMNMEWTISPHEDGSGDWVVSAINFTGDGEIYTTIFSDSDAERRAREYAARESGLGLERERSEAVAWKQTAEQELRNVEYYRGLLVRIGESFREAARVQDDGGIADSVLVAKVPELVEQLWRDHASWKRVAEYRENGLDQHWKALTAYRAALSNEEDIEDGPEPGDPPRPNWAMKAAMLLDEIMAKHGVKVR